MQTVNDMVSRAALKHDKTQYDYTNQAWVINGAYKSCGHLSATCGCYGKLHADEKADYAHSEIE